MISELNQKLITLLKKIASKIMKATDNITKPDLKNMANSENNLSTTLETVAKRLEDFAEELRKSNGKIEATDKIIKEALLLALSSENTVNLVERLTKLINKS